MTHAVRGSLAALVLVLLSCTAAPSGGDPLAVSSPTAAFTPVTSPQGSPEVPAPSRTDPAVLPSPSSPTPAPVIETPAAAHISSTNDEDMVEVKGLLVHPNLSPAGNVCVIVGPQAIRCTTLSAKDGTFVVPVPKDSDVTWTFHYFAGDQEKGHQSIAGPFTDKTFQLPAFSIP